MDLQAFVSPVLVIGSINQVLRKWITRVCELTGTIVVSAGPRKSRVLHGGMREPRYLTTATQGPHYSWLAASQWRQNIVISTLQSIVNIGSYDLSCQGDSVPAICYKAAPGMPGIHQLQV